MKTVSLSPLKSQLVSVSLGGQHCVIRLVQRESALYLDLTSNGDVITQGAPCLYGNRIVRYPWLGFKGDLFFVDRQGQDDPFWRGLGQRFLLYYLEASDFVQ